MNCQNELPYNSFPASHSSIQPKGISSNRRSHATFKCMTPKGERILCMAATVSGNESGACVSWTELGKIYVSQNRVKNSQHAEQAAGKVTLRINCCRTSTAVQNLG